MNEQENYKQSIEEAAKDYSDHNYIDEGVEVPAFVAGADFIIERACMWLYQWNARQVEKHGSKATIGCKDFTIPVNDFRNAMKGVEK